MHLRKIAALSIAAAFLVTACGSSEDTAGAPGATPRQGTSQAPSEGTASSPAGAVDTSTPSSTALAYVRAWDEQDCRVMDQVVVADEKDDDFPPNGDCQPSVFTDFADNADWSGPVDDLQYSVENVTAKPNDFGQVKVTIKVSTDPDEWTVYLVQQGSDWLV